MANFSKEYQLALLLAADRLAADPKQPNLFLVDQLACMTCLCCNLIA